MNGPDDERGGSDATGRDAEKSRTDDGAPDGGGDLQPVPEPEPLEGAEGERSTGVPEEGDRPGPGSVWRGDKRERRVAKKVALRNRGAAPVPEQALRNHNGMVNATKLRNGSGRNGLRNRGGLSNGRGPSGNGLVNGGGTGRVNGLVNGVPRARRGLVNGALIDAEGARNGRGMVNGRGIINGESIMRDRSFDVHEPPLPQRRTGGKLIIGGAVAAVVLILLALYLLPLFAERGMSVDGVFQDWEGVRRTADETGDQPNTDIDIRECALRVEGQDVFFYLRTGGRCLAGRDGGVDSVYFFMDTDQDPATGYPVGSAGAESVLIIDGYDGRVSACGLYRFSGDGSRPANDWNSRTASGPARAAVSGGRLEAQAPLKELGARDGGRMNVVAWTRDGRGGEDLSPVFSTERPALRVVWTQTGPESIAPGASAVEMLRLELTSEGGGATISGLRVTVSGVSGGAGVERAALFSAAGIELPGSSSEVPDGRVLLSLQPPLEVPASGAVVLKVCVWISPSAESGRALGTRLTSPADIIASTKAVTVEGEPKRMTYIGGPPTRVWVDGAFSDWAGAAPHPDPAGDVSNPDIDVTDFRTASDGGELFFYIAVGGEMMGGASVPDLKARPSGGGGGPGGPVSLPVLTGQDAFFVFLDTDRNPATGYSGGGVPLGADYMVNVTGQHGTILSRRLHSFEGGEAAGEWRWSAGADIEAASDGSRLEAGLPLSQLGSPSGNLSLFYYSTDWRDRRDTGDRVEHDLGTGRGCSDGGPGRDLPEGAGLPLPPDPTMDPPLHAPEFGELLLPIAGVVALFASIRRIARRGKGL
ncbi:MAG: hypothetical protein ACUVV6_02800 [Thermoplasmatota archaeon]